MGIANYIKEIGRGKDGARALNREQAADLFGQVLDGTVTDLEIGACWRCCWHARVYPFWCMAQPPNPAVFIRPKCF